MEIIVHVSQLSIVNSALHVIRIVTNISKKFVLPDSEFLMSAMGAKPSANVHC